MKVGIIVYSQTGNTLSVAEKIAESLSLKGQAVELLNVETESAGPGPGSRTRLRSAPDVAPFDAIIFASPVQGFSLAPAMKAYLSQIGDLSGKKIHCFVTQHFKKAWMGGNRAVSQMSSVCKSKGGSIISTGIVNWSSDKREQQIEEIVAALSAI